MTRGARVVFALLVGATFAAFFVAQRVKATPSVVVSFRHNTICSPNGDGRHDACIVSFRLKHADDVTVQVLGSGGDPVRTLAASQTLPGFRRFRMNWDGRTDAGARAPDGLYRFRVNLRRGGRAIDIPGTLRLDTTPPRPVVAGIGPQPGTPELFPDPAGRPLSIRVSTPARTIPTEVSIYRTDPAPARLLKLASLHGSGTVTWDGTVNGRRVRPGTYVVGLRTRDRAGNEGTSPGPLPPRAPFGRPLPGHAGITVRYLGVQTPLEPVVAGQPVTFGVDARREPYAWSVRRVGRSRPRARGRGARAGLVVRAPRGVSGAYVLQVRTARHTTSVPFVVQALRRRPVLVVLPAILWQGLNPADDDGDGEPNTLARGVSVLRDRVLVQGLPGDLVGRVGPLLAFLDRQGLRYDLTSDLALAAGDGAQPAGHAGVLLAGDERWLPLRAQLALRRYVRGGGKLASFGVDSLRRQVRLTARRLTDPTAPSAADALGFTFGPLAQGPVTLTTLDDKIGLFQGDVFGGTGQFTAIERFEPVAALPPGARTLASAVTPKGRPVIVAARVGRGMAIHVGLPGLPARLADPGNETALVRRVWTLISR